MVVMLDDAVHLHQRKDGVVGVMREQLTPLCQTHGIDAVRLEGLDGEVGPHGHDHQGQEQGISSRELGNEEDAGERRVHDTTHQSAHAQHGKIALRDVHAQKGILIPEVAEDKAADTAQTVARR